MKKYTEEEIQELREAALLMIAKDKAKSMYELQLNQVYTIKGIKGAHPFTYLKKIKSEEEVEKIVQEIKNKAAAKRARKLLRGENDVEEGPRKKRRIKDEEKLPKTDILNLKAIKEAARVDNLSQPAHFNISDVYADSAYIQKERELYLKEDVLNKNILKKHPLKREIYFIDFILRNPNEALKCNEYGIDAIYDNIPIFLPITLLIQLELVLRYLYATSEQDETKTIFAELGDIVDVVGYTTNWEKRSNVHQAITKQYNKYAADFISKVLVYKKGVIIPDNISTYALYDKFVKMIVTIITSTPYAHLLIAKLCTDFFREVYIAPEIIYAIRQDTDKDCFTYLKDYVKSPDKLQVGSWHAFFTRIKDILLRKSNISKSTNGVRSKLIKSTSQEESELLILLNEIRIEVIKTNVVTYQARAGLDKKLIEQSVTWKKELKETVALRRISNSKKKASKKSRRYF